MLIDVVNNQNAPVDVIDRSKVLECGKNFRTVHAWLVDCRHRMILQRLTNDHPRSPHLLGSSVAGYLHAGETYHDAITRKACAEVGTKPRNLHELGTIAMLDRQSKKFVTLYAGTILNEPRTQDAYIEGFEFLRLEDVHQKFKQRPESFTATFRALYEHFGSIFVQ